MNNVTRVLETVLWESRMLTLIAVLASFSMWLLMLFMTTVDTFYLLGEATSYLTERSGEARADYRAKMIGGVISIVDGYLIVAVLYIFTLGLYRQFIGDLRPAEDSYVAGRILDTDSFEGLKGRLARVVVLVLVVKFLQQALAFKYESSLDLTLLGVSVLAVGGAIYLSHLTGDHGSGHGHRLPERRSTTNEDGRS